MSSHISKTGQPDFSAVPASPVKCWIAAAGSLANTRMCNQVFRWKLCLNLVLEWLKLWSMRSDYSRIMEVLWACSGSEKERTRGFQVPRWSGLTCADPQGLNNFFRKLFILTWRTPAEGSLVLTLITYSSFPSPSLTREWHLISRFVFLWWWLLIPVICWIWNTYLLTKKHLIYV